MMLVIFFFNDTATTEIYTLSLHDALPIFRVLERMEARIEEPATRAALAAVAGLSPRQLERLFQVHIGSTIGVLSIRWVGDRKSTRLNSSHANISYSVFCLQKKTI